MIAILNAEGQVLGYDVAENADNYTRTEPLTYEEYMAQLEKPGIYTLTASGWTYAPLPTPEPTETDIMEEAANAELAALDAASLELLKAQANATAPGSDPDRLHRIAPLFTAWADLIGKNLQKTAHPYITHDGDIYLVNQDVGVVLAHRPYTPGAYTAGQNLTPQEDTAMVYEIDPVEHGQLMADIARLKEDVKDGRITDRDLSKRLEDLEHLARQNDREHERFNKSLDTLHHIEQSLKKIEDGTLVINQKQARDRGDSWLSIITSNPKYLVWIVAGIATIFMVFMGYSMAEIAAMLDRIKY